MKIKKFIFNPFQINCYIYWDEISKEGIIIDPAVYDTAEEILIREFITDSGIAIKYIINTHGHIDHILGNAFSKTHFKVPLLINKEDEFLVRNAFRQAEIFGLRINNIPAFDNYIDESLKINLGTNTLSFINTPGHSPGSVCIADERNKNVFTGDTIFFESVGRTDLPGGNHDTLISVIKNKLFKICGDDFKIYPGHGESTTTGYEKRNNPFLI